MGSILNYNYFTLVLLHVALGFVVFLYRPLAALILPVVLVMLILLVINNRNRNNEALMAAAYMAGGEVFFRMTHATVFWETGKYSVILFLLIGMFYKGASAKTIPYWIYLLLLFPAIFVASQSMDSTLGEFRRSVAFNLSGPVCLGISALYCYYKKISKKEFNLVLLMLVLPLVSNMVYLYFRTPSVGETLMYGTNSNFATSGGYGPNQIATVLGLGAVILFMRLFTIKNKFINVVDLILFALMSYRALVTFSRGGVVTAIICIVAFVLLFYYKQNAHERSGILFKLGMLGIAALLVVGYTARETQGLIVNRYTGRDASGELKDDITTGRVELFVTELEGFYNNPFIGIGVDRGKKFRGWAVASHNELSRLLSEHGMFGIFAILILIFVPLLFWLKFKNNYYFLAFVAFWFLTINHSAMRIALPAFVYGLALLYIVEDKKKPGKIKRLEAKTAGTAIE
ncbi:O-Antigen ligase [Salinimicrobium sediminis]|uniref:O-Antigen ligase n=1 Tax=Salinimicrobium sediminis TaxID=1343891 RepID=A0A285X2F0_9FLAO|nr:O-antigen ligase family protein [Salinimicrobium sediminis]SOC78549.1 O-Antigen ligase [Salinimicrobium sediminis]